METAFADPKIVEKANAALRAMPVCKIEHIHCPWWKAGKCTLTRCPAADLDVN